MSKFFTKKSDSSIKPTTENVSLMLNKEVELVKKTPILSSNESNDSFEPKESVNTKKNNTTNKKPKSPPPKKSAKTKEEDTTSELTIANFTDLQPVKLKGLDMESKLYEALKKYYNYDKFKSDTQKKAIFEIVKREGDVYVSMPTGILLLYYILNRLN